MNRRLRHGRILSWNMRLITALVMIVGPVLAGTVTWDNGGDATSWSSAANWSGDTEPALADDAVLPATYSGTKTLSSGETANSITVGDNATGYTLSGGDLTLGNGSQVNAGAIDVYSNRTFTIFSTLAGASGLTKTSAGTLTLAGVNLLTGGITINAGTVDASGANRVALGNNAITLNGGGASLGNNTTPVYLREFGGSSAVSADQLELRISSLNDTTYSGGGIGAGGQGVGLQKTGPGTLSITGGSVYDRSDRATAVWRGGLTFGGALGALLAGYNGNGADIYNGTLTLDNTTANLADRYGSMPVQFYGGGNATFRYIGNASADSAETVGALTTIGYGITGTIDVQPGSSGNAALTFASYGLTGGNNINGPGAAMANFTTGTGNTFGSDAKVLFTAAPTLQYWVLQGGIVKGTDFATYESTTPKGIMAFGSAGSGTTYVNPTDLNTPGSTNTVLIDANTTTLALTGNKQYNALKIDGTRTLNLAGNTLFVGQSSTTAGGAGYLGAMILKTGAGQAEITSTSSGGLDNAGTHGSPQNDNLADNFHFYVNEGVLKVTARVLAMGSWGRLRVNKAGPGLLWLEPVATWPATFSVYGSGIYFSEGAIRLDPDSGAFGNQPMVLNGGVMEIEGGGTYAPTFGTGSAYFRWQTSGGFAAYGTDATFSPAITWGTHIPDGAALLLNSTTADKKITLSGTLNLGTSATAMYLREIEVADNTGSTTDLAEISGKIISNTATDESGTATYTYHLVKTGAGTLILSHTNNTYSGATYVKGGTLLVNGTLAAPAASDAMLNPDYSAVTVMNGGTLGGTGTVTRVVKVESGGALVASGAGMTVGGNLALGSGATCAVQINGSQCSRVTVNGTVDVTGATLVATEPVRGTGSQFTIISNDGSDPVTGTFAGLPEGATVSTGVRSYRISYCGGDGNDVVLTIAGGGTVVIVQ